jgi:hypothetical protein
MFLYLNYFKIQNYHKYTHLDFIIDTIRDGYKIPFYSSSPSVYLSNNMSGLKNANFVDTVLQYRDIINKITLFVLLLLISISWSIIFLKFKQCDFIWIKCLKYKQKGYC